MNLYTYSDNNAGGKCIYQTKAETILEADKLFFEATEINPRAKPNIGCSIDFSIEKDVEA